MEEKKIISTGVQYEMVLIPPRMIVKFIKESGEEEQNIVNYSDLSDDEKATFDAFKELCVNKMV